MAAVAAESSCSLFIHSLHASLTAPSSPLSAVAVFKTLDQALRKCPHPQLLGMHERFRQHMTATEWADLKEWAAQASTRQKAKEVVQVMRAEAYVESLYKQIKP